MLQIKPILVALKRHKAGTILIALQIALTLAIVCNALFIIQQRVNRLQRPTGMVETDLLTVQNRFVGVNDLDTAPLIRSDVLALRQIPGVEDAYATNSYPLRGGGWSTGAKVDPNAKKSMAHTTQYFGDEHALATMGLKLIAGRNFNASEVVVADQRAIPPSPGVIVSKALADKLFPGQQALGKPFYLGDNTAPSAIIGIVERLQVPWSGTWSDNFNDNAVLLPVQLKSNFTVYLVRAKPGELAAITRSVKDTLFKNNHMRVINGERGIRTFDVVRDQAYKSDRGMAILMGVVCLMLLAITAAGIVGLTSFWVGQRRKQIGVRRALGATKRDILSYFMTENLMIGLVGVVVGAGLAIGMNLWLVSQFEMARLSLFYVFGGIVLLLLLGQGAVLAPAMRASRVSPVEATRSA
ncbi:MAG TPA: FtsX-like permease family protein [Dyella sp.]|uniref:ABC transporter permease n=1 Tax=Dyella sp. TaxID=1869338 RepID=UPI002F920B3F